MELNTDDIAIMQRAIMRNRTLASTNLPQTAEFKQFFAELEDQINNPPEGVVLEVIEDASFGQWDTLIAANEKARDNLS
jgi:hypothetical protein